MTDFFMDLYRAFRVSLDYSILYKRGSVVNKLSKQLSESFRFDQLSPDGNQHRQQ